ncbi:FadR/GntR family transcriptional regulator [Antribacter gilvus]|uniref:FadR/GntR family transcriptional regulator n=1 Tax=Antribacter gilvus TaxID=2304675 RepID=UPI000F7A83ED|nr:FadR/GntR family transcriptional regulator [Antribacter gilvus]
MALTDDAIAKIRDMIVSGELKPGQRLPPEKELSDALGLSRSSLREAVKALELIRVLDVRRGDGTYVTTLEPDLLLEAVSFVVDLHQDASLLELFEARRLLEPQAAGLAAVRMSEEDLRALRGIVDDVGEDTAIDALVAHDLAFHARITAACGNSYLRGMIDALSSRTVRARIWRGLTESGSVQRTLDEHHAIVDALEQRDPDLVRALVTVHVHGVERWLRRVS